MKKFFKWLSIGLVSLFLLLFTAAIIVPLVVDVDKYRPQIVQAANEQINGKLDLGKLSLSLWGQIRVEVQGLTLKDSSGNALVSVKDAFFHLPFSSILMGSPELIFKMEKPEVVLIKDKLGKLNLMGLVKVAPATPSAQKPSGGTSTQPPAHPTQAQKIELPPFFAKGSLSVELKNALLSYLDQGTGLSTQVKDLNLAIKDISLMRATSLELWADLDTVMGKTFALKGPARLTAQIKPEWEGSNFDHVTIGAKLDLDAVEMSSGTLFHKAKAVPCNVDVALSVSPKEAKVEHLIARFHNAEIKSTGTLKNLNATSVVEMQMVSNEIDLKSWNTLIPMLKEFDLAGVAKIEASAHGPSDRLDYKAKLGVHGLTAKAPNLKSQPRFDAEVDVATDEIQKLQITMKAPGNDLSLKGKLISFSQPQAAFELTSSGLDLDQLIQWPPPAAPVTAAAPGAQNPSVAPASPGTPTSPKIAAVDVDASLDPLRTNPALAGATFVLNARMNMIKAKGIKISDLVGRLYFKNLTAGLEGFAMKIWSGSIKANFAAQLKPKTPTYTFSSIMDGLQLKEAVAENVQMFKNTLVGKAHFDINGSGASFNTEPAKSNLKAKGLLKVENATFATIDVAHVATDALNKAIERVGEKIPAAKGKTLAKPSGGASTYSLIASSFTIDNGMFHAPDFVAKAAPNQGIDIKGDTWVGLKDYSLKTNWDLVDTYNLTQARDISVDVAGTRVDHILAEGANPVKFTVHAGCTCMQPCYSYTEVPEQLAKVALNNVSGAASARVKSEVQKRIQSVIPQAAPPAVKKAVEDLSKKFFR
ncbi:AsmA family protein [Bdellovibrionota bacterium FG-1]